MKKIIFMLLMSVGLFASVSSECKDGQHINQVNQIQQGKKIEGCSAFASPRDALDAFRPERNGNQGCCSWHGGVKGCSGGRIVCKDGTISPTCTC